MLGESVSKLIVGSRLREIGRQWPVAEKDQAWCQRCGQTGVGRCLALFGSVGQRAFAHSLYALECSKEVWGRMVSSSSFWRKSGPCLSAETVNACALIGLHVMAEENALRTVTLLLTLETCEVWLPKKPTTFGHLSNLCPSTLGKCPHCVEWSKHLVPQYVNQPFEDAVNWTTKGAMTPVMDQELNLLLSDTGGSEVSNLLYFYLFSQAIQAIKCSSSFLC